LHHLLRAELETIVRRGESVLIEMAQRFPQQYHKQPATFLACSCFPVRGMVKGKKAPPNSRLINGDFRRRR